MHIATLTPDDWRDLKTLRLEALQTEPAAFSSTYEEALTRSDEVWHAQLAAPRRTVMMARENAIPVGMAGAYRGADDGDQSVAIIFGMYVSATFRGRGVGGLLLSSLLDHVSIYPEITTVRLWVTETQEAARRLYEASGFRVVGRDERQLQGDGRLHDELIMERPIHHHPVPKSSPFPVFDGRGVRG